MSRFAVSRHGLILSSTLSRTGRPSDALTRAAARGELRRLRRGVYCEVEQWASLDARGRHLLRCRAVAETADGVPVLAGLSAAAAWGMPILGTWPEDVEVATTRSGGRSSFNVRRLRIPADVEVAERDGLLVTGLARTTLDVIRPLQFAPALGSLDWALWHRNPLSVTLPTLHRELERMNPRYGRAHLDAVLAFGTGLSDSFGESMTRAVMFELGYPVPDLQVRFTDRFGTMIVDYFWREQRIVGEFDGDSKYLRPAYHAHLSPGEIVLREKRREDRLRRQVATVIRIVMSDTLHPPRLDALLREYGLRPSRNPRTPRKPLPAPVVSRERSG